MVNQKRFLFFVGVCCAVQDRGQATMPGNRAYRPYKGRYRAMRYKYTSCTKCAKNGLIFGHTKTIKKIKI